MMVDLNPVILMMTLNMNGLNFSIKGKRSSDWIKSKTPVYDYYKRSEVSKKTQIG